MHAMDDLVPTLEAPDRRETRKVDGFSANTLFSKVKNHRFPESAYHRPHGRGQMRESTKEGRR